MAKKNLDNCPICGEYIDVIVSGYRDEEFITGKKYEHICMTCACVPKNSFVVLLGDDLKSKELLNNVEEMVADGFNKRRVELSLKAIKSLLKKR